VITFLKQPKKNCEEWVEFYYLLVYDVEKREVVRIIDNKSSVVPLRDAIYVMEVSPFSDSVVMTADYSGNIILWDIEEGVLLNYFSEKGVSLDYPNTPCPVMDGRFSGDGRLLIISTFYGTVSIYGIGCKDPYKVAKNK
jgi:WD40 repeat protein